MGLEPGTTRDDVRRCLERWNEGDNGILYHSRAYKLKPGTGWQIDPGILHAPGSLVTYEPQVNSDVFAMYQSLVEGRTVPWDLLVKDVPAGASSRSGLPARHAGLGRQHRSGIRQAPPLRSDSRWPRSTDMADAGYCEKWIVYSTPHYSAKELTVFPGRTVTITRRRRLRPDSDARLRHDRQARGGDAHPDPLRPDDQRRAVRHRRRRRRTES